MAGEKKSKKKWIIIAVVVVLLLLLVGSCSGGSDSSSSDSSDSSAASSSSSSAASEQASEDATEPEPQVIELVAGEKGEYGKKLVMSEGTDMEEALIVYYLPAGDYTVKNVGEYRTQVTVYKGVKKGDNGYDEYTKTGDIVMLDPDQTDDINIPDGWFIEIQEPTHIELTAKA
ncbi:MAG: hypothetical protein PUD02_06570 [Eggerthellales bacterium]|nr:hypothetical protein [Eggerthellales bacterium]